MTPKLQNIEYDWLESKEKRGRAKKAGEEWGVSPKGKEAKRQGSLGSVLTGMNRWNGRAAWALCLTAMQNLDGWPSRMWPTNSKYVTYQRSPEAVNLR